MTNISMKPISMQWVTAQLLLSMTCVSVTASLNHEEERAGCSQSGGQRQSRSFLATESKSLLGKDSTNEEETDGLSKHCTYECVCTEGLEWLDYQLLDQLYSLKYIQNTACCFYFCSAPQDRLTTEKCLTVGRISPINHINTNRTPRLFLPGEYESTHILFQTVKLQREGILSVYTILNKKKQKM